jgi:CheY-like chemotaxis protein
MNGNHILLVEDNADDEFLAVRALRRNDENVKITVAHDGRETLDILFDTTVRLPALVLMDVKLPKVSGLEVLQQIRATDRTALVPVVMLSSSTEDRDLLDGYRAGCNSYIRKPVDFLQFAEAMRELKLYWLTINQAAPSNTR